MKSEYNVEYENTLESLIFNIVGQGQGHWSPSQGFPIYCNTNCQVL